MPPQHRLDMVALRRAELIVGMRQLEQQGTGRDLQSVLRLGVVIGARLRAVGPLGAECIRWLKNEYRVSMGPSGRDDGPVCAPAISRQPHGRARGWLDRRRALTRLRQYYLTPARSGFDHLQRLAEVQSPPWGDRVLAGLDVCIGPDRQ
jgi:hypothetical protein